MLSVPDRPRVRARQRQAPAASPTPTPPPSEPSTWSTWPTLPTAASAPTPRACASASRWPPRWSTTRRCWSSTSPSTAWTRGSACTCSSCCGQMADEGRTVLLSSHILEEVERIADSVLVIYAGRLAASGDFRSIRRLMTDRPHVFSVRSSRRPTPGVAAARRGVRLRRRARSQGPAGAHLRLWAVHAAHAGRRARGRHPPARAAVRPTIRSSRSSPTWWADDPAACPSWP